MIRKEIAAKLDQYGGFHDSKVRSIFLETSRCILGITIDYAHDVIPSLKGEVIISEKPGGGPPQRFSIRYRPMTVLFKGISQVVVDSESDPVNDEIILSCQLSKPSKTKSLGEGVVHIEMLLTSSSRLDIYCRDMECKTQ